MSKAKVITCTKCQFLEIQLCDLNKQLSDYESMIQESIELLQKERTEKSILIDNLQLMIDDSVKQTTVHLENVFHQNMSEEISSLEIKMNFDFEKKLAEERIIFDKKLANERNIFDAEIALLKNDLLEEQQIIDPIYIRKLIKNVQELFYQLGNMLPEKGKTKDESPVHYFLRVLDFIRTSNKFALNFDIPTNAAYLLLSEEDGVMDDVNLMPHDDNFSAKEFSFLEKVISRNDSYDCILKIYLLLLSKE